MNHRLARIERLMLSLTAVGAVVALASSSLRPFGIVCGGAAAWLDFVVIRILAAKALAHRAQLHYIVPLAFAKSAALLAVPALALLLPASLINGVSFAIGVSVLPVAVVVDALAPQTARASGGV